MHFLQLVAGINTIAVEMFSKLVLGILLCLVFAGGSEAWKIIAAHPSTTQRRRMSMRPAHANPTTNNDQLRNQLSKTVGKVLSIASATVLTSSIMAPQSVNAYGVVEEPKSKKKAKIKVGETDLGIKYIDLKVGDGPSPYEGDVVSINYLGFKMDGTEFDSQYAKKNLAFKFGAKQVTPGFEDVLAGMKPGGQRSCTIPSKYMYGKKGVCLKDGCIVEPDEDLKFVITLKSVGAGYN